MRPAVGREVEVREQDLPGPEPAYSSGWGSLTFTIMSAGAKTSSAPAATVAPGAHVFVVADRGALARPGLDHDA